MNKIDRQQGLAYGNIASYPDNESAKEVKKEIADDRKQSLSVKGNFDLVILILRKYFVDLEKLKIQSARK